MRCPFCRHGDSRVIDSREVDDGLAIRRRRSCAACGRRFTTVEEAVLAVVKRSGVTEPFSRDKVVSGVRRACQGRPVDEDALAQLAHRVEEAVRAGGRRRDPQPRGGARHPRPLRELDEVAYMRFASVYTRTALRPDTSRSVSIGRASRRLAANCAAWAGHWRGRRMSLILDHINGVRDDNRLENLHRLPELRRDSGYALWSNTATSRSERTCEACGAAFRPKHGRHRYCSRACGSHTTIGPQAGVPAPHRREGRSLDRPRLLQSTPTN